MLSKYPSETRFLGLAHVARQPSPPKQCPHTVLRQFMRHQLRQSRHYFAVRWRGCLVLVGSALLASTIHAEELRMAGDNLVQPFEPLIAEVVATAGFKAVQHFYPGERTLRMLTRNEVDVAYPHTKVVSDIYPGRFALVGPVACIELAAFTRRDSPFKLASPRDFKGLTMGSGTAIRAAARYAKVQGLNFETVPNRESAFKMLEQGRLDVVLDARRDGWITLQKLDMLKSIAENGPVLQSEPVYLAVSKQNKAWAPRLQTAFKTAIDNRTWQKAVQAMNLKYNVAENFGLSCLRATPHPRDIR